MDVYDNYGKHLKQHVYNFKNKIQRLTNQFDRLKWRMTQAN